MYKISIPISMSQICEETLPIYLEDLRKCNAKRVFLCGLGNIYMNTGLNYTNPDKIKYTIEYFKKAGVEVGVWVPSFGNGHALSPIQAVTDDSVTYHQITGVNGESMKKLSACPLDENFVRDYCKGIQLVAALEPDLIMLDDDFRLNIRNNIYFACFCELHLKEYYKRIKEVIPRDELEKHILTGGKNKYRTELLKLFGDTMIGFARKVREAVDKINPAIRVGACTHQTWDMHGTDPIALAKAFAGNTKPFARISGAPFRNINIVPIIEYSRQQCAWGKGSGVELFAEGDTWPRPRTCVPSKPTELFDLTLCSSGCTDGILAYLECYDNRPDFESGYVTHFSANNTLRQNVLEMFQDKKPTGVEIICVPHKAETWDLPQALQEKTAEMLIFSTEAPSRDLLSANSIPSSYGQDDDYPLLIIGENAKHFELDRLKRGAILDIPAAHILQTRGVDVGLLSFEDLPAGDEQYASTGDIIRNIKFCVKHRICCKENAQVLSRFVPGDTPASYRYENKEGQRFYVLAFNMYSSWELIRKKPSLLRRPNFEQNYLRQADLICAIEWIAGKRLPATSRKHPNLYILASKNENAMSVALANVHLDDVYAPEIILDRQYSRIRFLNCTGQLNGDRVILSDIPPYGFAAFEVK